MTTIPQDSIVFNLVWTGRAFRLMKVFTESILRHSDVRLRFVANACPPDEIALMEEFATLHPDRVTDVLDVSPDVMLAHGEALDRVIEIRDDGDHFAFLDPDILASGPFMTPYVDLLLEHDAVTSATELWSDDNVQPADHLGIGVGGRHFFSPDGFVYGSPHMALYRRDALLETMQRWQVGLGFAGPDLSDEARSRIDKMGLLHKMYDTGKIVNILFQADGNSLTHTESPALLHIGGLSHFVAPATTVEGPDGEREAPWVRNPAVRDRATVARYTAEVLEALEGGRPLPDVPADEERLERRLHRVHEAFSGRPTPAPAEGDASATFDDDFDHYVANHDFLTPRHTLQVTSFGGTGTTALCQYFMDHDLDLQPGPAHWPFKHARVPPAEHEVPEGFRVVYLLGDPRNSVVSLFRRNYQEGHARAMHHDWRAALRRRAAGMPDRDPSEPRTPPATAARLSSLETYLASGVDDFGFESHLAEWRNHPPGYPVMFVQYEQLADHWEELCAFVGISPDEEPLEIRERSSDWTSLPRHQQAQMQRLYGGLASYLETLPAIEII